MPGTRDVALPVTAGTYIESPCGQADTLRIIVDVKAGIKQKVGNGISFCTWPPPADKLGTPGIRCAEVAYGLLSVESVDGQGKYTRRGCPQVSAISRKARHIIRRSSAAFCVRCSTAGYEGSEKYTKQKAEYRTIAKFRFPALRKTTFFCITEPVFAQTTSIFGLYLEKYCPPSRVSGLALSPL